MDKFKEKNTYAWSREELTNPYRSIGCETKGVCKYSFRKSARTRLKEDLIRERLNKY